MYPIIKQYKEEFQPQSQSQIKKQIQKFGWDLNDSYGIYNPLKDIYTAVGFDRFTFNKDTLGIQRAGVFPVEDYSKLQEYNKKINFMRWLGDLDNAVGWQDDLNTFLEYRYNDHHPNILHNYKVEAIDASVHHNKVTSAGVVGMVYILAQQSDRYFNFVSMGRGQQAEAIGQKFLQDEELRVSVITDGSQAARGNVWNHVGNLGYGAISGTYYEFGIHDLIEDNPPNFISRLLARSVMPNGLQHTQNETFVTGSHSMIFEIL